MQEVQCIHTYIHTHTHTHTAHTHSTHTHTQHTHSTHTHTYTHTAHTHTHTHTQHTHCLKVDRKLCSSFTFLLALMANIPASVHTLRISAPETCVCVWMNIICPNRIQANIIKGLRGWVSGPWLVYIESMSAVNEFWLILLSKNWHQQFPRQLLTIGRYLAANPLDYSTRIITIETFTCQPHRGNMHVVNSLTLRRKSPGMY